SPSPGKTLTRSPLHRHTPSSPISTHTTSCPPRCRPSRTEPAEDSEISCSEERPPASTATVSVLALETLIRSPPRPAPPPRAAALASPWPTTAGTVTRFGACATVRLTLAPLASELPPWGDCASTLPAFALEDTCELTLPTSSPALVSAASAAVWDSPTTSGTRTIAGPLDTSTVTALPS